MEFYVVKRWQKPPEEATYPCVTLSADAWDDFGWVTQFYPMLWTSGKTSRQLGPVKILQRDAKTTQLPEKFTELPARFCSLGQERAFYETIARMGEQGVEILTGLRDVVFSPELAAPFTRSAGFRSSLLRLSEAADNYQRAGVLFGHPARIRPLRLNFAFEHKFDAFSAPHRVECHFPEPSALPHRVLAFVGRNGTGKTAVMAEIARQLSGVSTLSRSGFSPERPEFSRVVAISYSPFGPFRYPSQRTSSYRYCGLFDRDGRIDNYVLQQRVRHSLSLLAEDGRATAWLEALQACGLIEAEPALRAMKVADAPGAWLRAMERLSSGHYTAVTILLDCAANLMTNSLLLLDEPELYLHPNLMSALMRAIDDLLNVFDAYAILATHSPIILQEIPGRCVHVFSRMGTEPHCMRLDTESFGESLTNITNQVFGAGRGDKNYMQILNDIATGLSEAEVNTLFDGRLGLNARAYVRAIVDSPEGR